jgi:hypothetical protein
VLKEVKAALRGGDQTVDDPVDHPVDQEQERMETTPRESEPASEHLAEPAQDADLIDAEIARLAADAETVRPAADGGPDPRGER